MTATDPRSGTLDSFTRRSMARRMRRESQNDSTSTRTAVSKRRDGDFRRPDLEQLDVQDLSDPQKGVLHGMLEYKDERNGNMAQRSIDPATGESGGGVRRAHARRGGRGGRRGLGTDSRRGATARSPSGPPRFAPPPIGWNRRRPLGGADGRRDGQAARPGAVGGREVRLGLPLLRGSRRRLPGAASPPRPTPPAASWPSGRSGPVLAVMPWNFPFWQVFRAAAPALMAGNTMLLKHASNVPGLRTGHRGDLRATAGLPDGAFRTLLDRERPGRRPDRRPRRAGRHADREHAGGPRGGRGGGPHLKKTVLELGGSDPYVVLEDADLEATVETCVTSRLINSGQSCIAAKRFIVVDEVREEFERARRRAHGRGDDGPPLEGDYDIGPLARDRPARRSARPGGAQRRGRARRLLLGGERPEGPGAFYPPTVLTDVAPGNPAREEELFGPVASIIPVADEAEAIAVANETSFGLGAAVFTRGRRAGRADRHRASRGGGMLRQRVRPVRPAAAVRRHQGERVRAASCRGSASGSS